MARINVVHDGMTFTDSDELGAYLNMSPNTLLAMINQGRSISEIINHNKLLWPMAERRRLKQGRQPSSGSNHNRPCNIAGKVYPSQAAAARAYHIPIQTIYSRVQRQNLSFEEAILRGYREEHLLAPTPELYTAFAHQLRPTDTVSCKSLSDFMEVLDAAGFSCTAAQAMDENVQGIQTSFEIQDGNRIELWLLYLRDKEFLEIVAPCLHDGPVSLSILNQVNHQTANIRFWLREERYVSASTGEKFRAASESPKYALRSLYQFLGACHDTLSIIKQPEH